MAKNKTAETRANVSDFINSFVDRPAKKEDSFRLIELMRDWSGFPPKMWGPSIIGFGRYHYKYASGHEGDAPMISFSPRKAAISLYVYAPNKECKRLLDDLGKFKMGKSCIYVKRLSDISIPVLHALCNASMAYLRMHHECA